MFTIEVHGAAAVSIDLLDESVELIFRELLVQLAEDLAQARCGNVTVACKYHLLLCFTRTHTHLTQTFSICSTRDTSRI